MAAGASVAALVAVAAVVSVPGCARKRKDNEVLVLCGGSMRAAIQELAAAYEATCGDEVVGNFAGSGELYAGIKATGRGDIYVCHDPFMPKAKEERLIGEWTTVGRLNVVIVVPKGSPKGIDSLEDLAKPALRLGIGNQTYSTSGQIVKQLCASRPYGKDILKNVSLETRGHQKRCDDVVMGLLDAGIVWDVVARLYRDRLDILPISLEGVDAITSATYKRSDVKNVRVTIGIVAGSADRPATRRFYDYLKSEAGQKVFAKLGFTPPLEETSAK
jgi:molybdate transport system substrate-binding protein